MYVVLAGRAAAYRHGNAGDHVDIRRFEDGDYFGEVALLDSKPRTATVACETECRLFVIEQPDFRDVLTANPGIVFGVLVALADRAREQIEEHYQVELANLALEAEAEVERHRSLGQMVAGVAHELNTPLGITNTAVDMIAKRLSRPDVVALFERGDATGDCSTTSEEATTLAQRNIARAHHLIQDFKKIAVDQLVEVPQREDLAELVASTVDLFTINARQAGLTIDIDDRLPATNREWFGYPGPLTQVLMNLLTNIERTPTSREPADQSRSSSPRRRPADAALHRSGPRPWLRHRSRAPGQDLRAILHDRPQQRRYRPRPVHRPQHRDRRPERQITVDSAPGQGTTFHITFPQEVAHV